MSVVERLAMRSARQRVKTQLEAELPTDLAAIIAEAGLGALGITDPADYVTLTSEVSALEVAERRNERTLVVIQQSPSFRTIRNVSGTASTTSAIRMIELEVVVIHHHIGAASPIESYTLTDLETEETILAWSEMYNGAVIQVMRDHVQCNTAATTVDLVSETARVEASLTRHGILGIATTAWEIRQDVSISQ